MTNFIKTVLLVRISVTVCLVVFLTVDTFEEMKTRLTFLCSKPWMIYVSILFAILSLLPIMLRFVRFIIFDILEHIQSTSKN